MNDVIKIIKKRRSIRKYTGEQISDEQLHEILEAGFYAPTARNMRPTHFIVIRNSEKLNKIAEEMPNAKYCTEAKTAIVVCGERGKDVDGYLAENCSAAIMNMLLAAESMGLGALWCGVYPREFRVKSLRSICGIPDSILPVGIVLIGVADEIKETPDLFEQEKVHYEQW